MVGLFCLLNSSTNAFGSNLQHSFSIINLEPTIPTKHAIELANAYITIEKMRFPDRIHFKFDIDENVNIEIQPLLENAINHDILQKIDGGTVTLRIEDRPNDVEITIADDGAGITKEKIEEVLNIKPTIDERIGIKNTIRRLLHLYKQGLEIDSDIGKGTTIRFRLSKE